MTETIETHDAARRVDRVISTVAPKACLFMLGERLVAEARANPSASEGLQRTRSWAKNAWTESEFLDEETEHQVRLLRRPGAQRDSRWTLVAIAYLTAIERLRESALVDGAFLELDWDAMDSMPELVTADLGRKLLIETELVCLADPAFERTIDSTIDELNSRRDYWRQLAYQLDGKPSGPNEAFTIRVSTDDWGWVVVAVDFIILCGWCAST